MNNAVDFKKIQNELGDQIDSALVPLGLFWGQRTVRAIGADYLVCAGWLHIYAGKDDWAPLKEMLYAVSYTRTQSGLHISYPIHIQENELKELAEGQMPGPLRTFLDQVSMPSTQTCFDWNGINKGGGNV